MHVQKTANQSQFYDELSQNYHVKTTDHAWVIQNPNNERTQRRAVVFAHGGYEQVPETFINSAPVTHTFLTPANTRLLSSLSHFIHSDAEIERFDRIGFKESITNYQLTAVDPVDLLDDIRDAHALSFDLVLLKPDTKLTVSELSDVLVHAFPYTQLEWHICRHDTTQSDVVQWHVPAMRQALFQGIEGLCFFDGGGVSKQSYADYVSSYLGDLVDAVTVFRDPTLNEVNVGWLNKVSDLQNKFDGQALRFAAEIDIARNTGYFDDTLSTRLDNFRQSIEDVVDHSINLPTAQTAPPTSIPGHTELVNAGALEDSITAALDYYRDYVSGDETQVERFQSEFGLVSEDLDHLRQIASDLSAGDVTTTQVAHDVFSQLAKFDRYVADLGVTSPGSEAVQLPWVGELTPAMQLARLQDPDFEPLAIGGISRIVSKYANDSAYNGIVDSNIPGVKIGLTYAGGPERTVTDPAVAGDINKALAILADGLDSSKPDHVLFAREIFAAAKVAELDGSVLKDVYGADGGGFILGVGNPQQLSQDTEGFTSVMILGETDADMRVLSEVILDRVATPDKQLSAAYHELWHVTSQNKFLTSADGTHTITLSDGKTFTWSNGGIEERLASGSRFVGELSFIDNPLNAPAGWISETTINEARGNPGPIFYPFDANDTDSPATRSLHIPEYVISDRLKQIKLPDSAVYFDNIYQTYTYLNQIQSEYQRLRFLDQALQDPKINNGISASNRELIQAELTNRYQILEKDLPKVATAVALLRYDRITHDAPPHGTFSNGDGDRSARLVLADILVAAGAASQQLPDGLLNSQFNMVEFTKEVKAQVQAIYGDFFFDHFDYGPDKLKGSLDRVTDLSKYFSQFPNDLTGLDRPAGIIGGTPETAAVLALRAFAEKLGVADKVFNTDTGSRNDFSRVIQAAQDGDGKNDALNAGLVDAIPDAEKVFKDANLSPKPLLEALGENIADVSGVHRTPDQFYFVKSDGGQLELAPFDPGSDVKGYDRVTLDNGDALYLPTEEGNTPFRFTEKFVERLTWLRSDGLEADVNTVSESIQFYRSLTAAEGRPEALGGMLSLKLLEFGLKSDNEITSNPKVREAFATLVADTSEYVISVRNGDAGKLGLNVSSMLEILKTTFGEKPELFINKVLDTVPETTALVFRAFPEFSAPLAIQQQKTIVSRYLNLETLAINELVRLTGDTSLSGKPGTEVLEIVSRIEDGGPTDNLIRQQVKKNQELLRASISALREQQKALVDTANALNVDLPDTNVVEQLPQLISDLAVELDTDSVSKFDAVRAQEVGNLLANFSSRERYVDTLNNQLLKLVTPEALYSLLKEQGSTAKQLLADGGYKDFYIDKLLERYLTSLSPQEGHEGLDSAIKHIVGAGMLVELDYAGSVDQQRQLIGDTIQQAADVLEKYKGTFNSEADYDHFATQWVTSVLDAYESLHQADSSFESARGFLDSGDSDHYRQLLGDTHPGDSFDNFIDAIDKPFGGGGGGFDDFVDIADPAGFTPRDDRGYRVPESNMMARLRSEKLARRLGSSFVDSVEEIRTANSLSGDWVPLLSSAQELDGGNYQVNFVNTADDTAEPVTIHTDSADIFRVRQFVDENDATALKAYKPDASGALKLREDVPDVEGVNGLNAAFAIHALVGFLERGKLAEETDSSQLATVLRAHQYLNLAQTAYGLALDGLEVIKLVKEGINISRTVVKEASAASKTVSAAASIGFGGVDILAGLASTGLDIYELTQAQSASEKAVIGTQLAFDVAGVGLGGVSLGLGITTIAATAVEATAVAAGAAAAGTIVGGAGVIFAGLGIGITALVQVFTQVSDDAKRVGKFFSEIDKTYKNGGFLYDGSKDIVKPVGQGIVDKVDFTNGKVSFGTHRIYRTHHGKTGSGAQNYFFWPGDFPTLVRDEKQALNVREKIGYGSSANLSSKERNAKIFIAPITPHTSTISYSWNTLPGSTTRHDEGFDVIRRIERDKKFDYDFYVTPSEYTIDDIDFKYQRSGVQINLDDRDRVIVIPDIPKEYRGKIYHNVYGHGGNYTLSLNDNAELYIHSPNKSNWIIETSNVESKSLRINDNTVWVGNAKAQFGDLDKANVLLNSTDGDISSIDFKTHKAMAIFVNGETINKDGHNSGKARGDLASHLKSLKDQGRLDVVTTVNRYHADGKVYDHVYYDRDGTRMLYSQEHPNADLVGFLQSSTDSSKSKVVFYDAQSHRLDIVDANNHHTINHAILPGFKDKVTVLGAVEEHGKILTRVRQTLANGRDVDYLFHEDNGTLVLDSVIGDNTLFAQLRDSGHVDGKALISRFSTDVKLAPQVRIVPTEGDSNHVHDRTVHHIDGKIYLQAGSHAVEISHDDGLKLVLGGKTLVQRDKWDEGHKTQVTFTADKTGYYDLNALYFESTGSAYLGVKIDGQSLDKNHFGGPDNQFLHGKAWFSPSGIYSLGTADSITKKQQPDIYYTIEALDFVERGGSLQDFWHGHATQVNSPLYVLPGSGDVLRPVVPGGDDKLVLVSSGTNAGATITAKGTVSVDETSAVSPAAGYLYYDPTNKKLYSQRSAGSPTEAVDLPDIGIDETGATVKTLAAVAQGLLVSDDKGASWLVSGSGDATLIAVSDGWVAAHDDWESVLKTHFGDNKTLALRASLGLTTAPPVLINGVSNASVHPQEFSLRGEVHYNSKNENVTSLEQAAAILAGGESTSYVIDSVDFREAGGNHSLSDFLQSHAELSQKDAGSHVHDHAVHNITGRIYLRAGEHSFDVLHDDGVRLTVGGETIFTDDNWKSSANQASFTAESDGFYDINVLYFDGQGPSNLKIDIDGKVLSKANFDGSNAPGHSLKTWYDPLSTNVLVANVSGSDNTRLVRIDGDRKSAWLYDDKSQQLYRQSLLTKESFESLTGTVVGVAEATSEADILTLSAVESNANYVVHGFKAGEDRLDLSGLDIVSREDLTIKSGTSVLRSDANGKPLKYARITLADGAHLTIYSVDGNAKEHFFNIDDIMIQPPKTGEAGHVVGFEKPSLTPSVTLLDVPGQTDLPAAQHILANETLTNVLSTATGLEVFTESGLVYGVDNNHLTISGVKQSWLDAGNTLPADASKRDTLNVFDADNHLKGWYLSQFGTLVEPEGLDGDDVGTYLGYSAESESAFIRQTDASTHQDTLYRISADGSATAVGEFDIATVLNNGIVDILALAGMDATQALNIPQLDDVKSLLLSPKDGGINLTLSDDLLQHYSQVTVDTSQFHPADDTSGAITVNENWLARHVDVAKTGNDLTILNRDTGHSLILKGITGNDDVASLHIRSKDNVDLSLGDIVDSLEQSGAEKDTAVSLSIDDIYLRQAHHNGDTTKQEIVAPDGDMASGSADKTLVGGGGNDKLDANEDFKGDPLGDSKTLADKFLKPEDVFKPEDYLNKDQQPQFSSLQQAMAGFGADSGSEMNIKDLSTTSSLNIAETNLDKKEKYANKDFA
ncbi:Toxin B [BD1-7 clade bacterium]|uniref:Toxin B n=1 Tax=BD1-7 clade bacterium TaxID=2029982 RepID=A0A5S9PXL0_9GAMM|nr:Toxin B [BD1-7 clade bacterium]CAA0113021.1 Toxin B [BD1-7 clade bacterium]